MIDTFAHLDRFLSEDGHAVLITIVAVQGSSPREVGTMMAMRADGRFTGTIGGGALEWQALGEAQKLMRDDRAAKLEKTILLGPDLGQCCGGRVTLRFERLNAADRSRLEIMKVVENRLPILLFGAGHVGRALVLALAPLPFDVRWLDPRRSEFPEAFPDNVTPVALENPMAEIAQALPGSAVLILTHSHALDLAIADAALRRDDLAFVGVIGSQTKRARFVSQLKQAGLGKERIDRFTCPIGLPDLGSKAPGVIAAGVAVQMLHVKAHRDAQDKDVPNARQSAG
ncbi:MAG: xanthine dehydrogenase accessory protein XdhC [Rhabdaerophilum sp.]